MKNFPGKPYKFDPTSPPAKVVSKLNRLEKLIAELQDMGVYFMADGNLHAFVRYKDGTRDSDISDRPYDECYIDIIAANIDGGDFW